MVGTLDLVRLPCSPFVRTFVNDIPRWEQAGKCFHAGGHGVWTGWHCKRRSRPSGIFVLRGVLRRLSASKWPVQEVGPIQLCGCVDVVVVFLGVVRQQLFLFALRQRGAQRGQRQRGWVGFQPQLGVLCALGQQFCGRWVCRWHVPDLLR